LIYPLISFIGLLGQVLAGPASPEQPLLARLISKGPLASWLKPFLFITIVAAILSTLDTAINSCCLFLSREIAGRSLKENSARQLRLSRLANVTIGFLAFLVASRFRSILQTIGLASEIMAEGLFIPVMAMFLLRSRFELAGLLSLISGASFACLSFLSGAGIIRTSLPSWPSSLPFGLSLSLLGFGLGLVIARIRDKKIK
jgi:SSS family solute:Na+ symporter